MKKIISLVIVFAMIFCLVGCNGDSDNTDVSTKNKELTVWAILSSNCSDYVDNYQTKWYEEKTGITVNWVTVQANGWADAFQKSVMSGEWPDIYLYDFDSTEVDACVEYNCIIPLNDLIKENCPNIQKYLDDSPEIKELITAPDGNIYTLFKESYNSMAYTQKLWVNKNWLASYETKTGKGMPETTAEFKDMLTYFRDNDMNGNGKQDEIPYLGANGLDGVYALADAFISCNSSSNGYGCYINANGEIEFTLNSPEFREALTYVSDLYSEGLITDKSFTTESKDRLQYIGTKNSNAQVGVVTAVSINDIVGLNDQEGSFDYSSFVAVGPLKGPNGFSSYVTQGENTVSLRNAITTSCKDPALAMQWLDYWYSEEGRLWSVNGGQEGTHWWYEDGESIEGNTKVVVRSTDSKLLENASWGTRGVAYMVKTDDFLKMDINGINRNNELTNYVADRKYSSSAIKSGWSDILWVTEETSSMATEYSELMPLIENHVTQSYVAFIMGKKDISNDTHWNEYCNELNKIGIDRFVELVKNYCEK